MADDGQRQRDRARRGGGVAAEQGDTEFALVLREAGGEVRRTSRPACRAAPRRSSGSRAASRPSPRGRTGSLAAACVRRGPADRRAGNARRRSSRPRSARVRVRPAVRARLRRRAGRARRGRRADGSAARSVRTRRADAESVMAFIFGSVLLGRASHVCAKPIQHAIVWRVLCPIHHLNVLLVGPTIAAWNNGFPGWKTRCATTPRRSRGSTSPWQRSAPPCRRMATKTELRAALRPRRRLLSSRDRISLNAERVNDRQSPEPGRLMQPLSPGDERGHRRTARLCEGLADHLGHGDRDRRRPDRHHRRYRRRVARGGADVRAHLSAAA